MRFLFSLFLFLFSFSATISCKEPLSIFEGDPAGFVHNSVDVLSGSYREFEVDATIDAPTPIVLKRSYTSQSGIWQYFPECTLLVGKVDNSIVATTSESFGTPLIYTACDKEGLIFRPDFTQYNKGIVNTAKEAIGAQTNLKNNYLTKIDDGFELTLCSGMKRFYKKTSKIALGKLCRALPTITLKDAELFQLVLEILPSGNKMLYHYDDDGRLAEICAVNNSKKKQFCKVSFSYKNDQVKARASDGQSVTYTFHHGLLVAVSSTSNPEITYRYCEVCDKKVLEKKKFPCGRFLLIKYQSDAKVKSLSIPLSKKPIFTFDYSEKSTDVFDQSGNKTSYRHDREKLLRVTKYEKEEVYSKEKLTWSELKGMPQLVSRTIEDKEGTIHSALRYSYDEHGNVNDEKSFGNPTAEDLTSQNLPEKIERLKQFHSPLSQTDAKGNKIAYEYKVGTNLIVKKLICEGKYFIKKRHFYFYNDDAVLIKEVVDDGSSSAFEDLRNATERHSIEVRPRTSSHSNRETIQEKYYDFTEKKDILKKKIRNEYDERARLIKHSLYDSKEMLAKTEKYSYDEHSNLISHTNVLGLTTRYSYDENDNCSCIKESSTGKKITLQYDLNDHVIRVKEHYSNAPDSSTAYEYDIYGNKIAEIDRYGNRTQYDYDFLSRLVSVTLPTVFNEKKESIKPKASFSYDILGNVTSEKDPKGYLIKRSYSGVGKQISVQYPDETKEHFYYNLDDTIERKIQHTGVVSFYQYDFAGRVSSYSLGAPELTTGFT